MKPIGKQIRQRREALGLTQEEVARKCFRTQWFMIDVEEFKTEPSLAELRAIADALDCDLVVKLKPRQAAVPENSCTAPGANVGKWLDTFFDRPNSAGAEHTERPDEMDADNVAVKAKMQEAVDKMKSLPWPNEPQNVGDWESLKRFMGVDHAAGVDHTESIGIVRMGDQTLTAPVLFVDAPLTVNDFYIEQPPQPPLPRSCLDEHDAKVVITPKADIPRKS